ncbi:putative Kinase-like domain-containing protein [Seiridium unicorne]|uniref:non-specific serine/threonine protein kinase n=1 Tax=Seiridium unicorne TaxID=138068 RepID=A0ABR2VIG9_9PEZI
MDNHSTQVLQEYTYDSTFAEYGTEDPSRYNKGGFHPVHLGDILDDRFEVIHKLGNGGYGTVWLCWDRNVAKWRALKIFAASHSLSDGDAKIFKHLGTTSSNEDLEAHHIAVPLDGFWIDGPNGRHLCFVMPILGPSVDNWRVSLKQTARDTAIRSKAVCRQIAEAIRFLHSKGVCHNDLKPKNILMEIDQDALGKLSKEAILETLGEPDEIEIETVSGAEPRPIAPEYCVAPTSFYKFKDLITGNIMVIDFGESFVIDSPKEGSGIPAPYAAPEVLFGKAPSIKSDIWSLACTLYQVRTDELLLVEGAFSGAGFSQVIQAIEVLLGPLLDEYRAVWDNKRYKPPFATKPKEKGGPATCSLSQLRGLQEELMSEKGYADVLSGKVGQQRATTVGHQDGTETITSEWTYSREESLSLGELLQKMLRYSPNERLSAADVCSHPWISGVAESKSSAAARTLNTTAMPVRGWISAGSQRLWHMARGLLLGNGAALLVCLVIVPALAGIGLKQAWSSSHGSQVHHLHFTGHGQNLQSGLQCSCNSAPGKGA